MKKETVYYWPKWLFKALPPERQKNIPPRLVRSVCRSQLDLWQALNIYDDFLDDEGQPEQLSLANAAYRRFLENSGRLGLTPAFYRLSARLFDRLDETNRQETIARKSILKKGRLATPKDLPVFDNPERLADKSLVLALGPLALTELADRKLDKKQRRATLEFFRLALAAKQLADDSHDWLEDLRAGRLTAANALILEAARKRRIKLDLERQPEIAYLLFAQEAAPVIINEIKGLCRRSRQQAIKARWDQKATLVQKLLNPLEKAANKATCFRQLLLKID